LNADRQYVDKLFAEGAERAAETAHKTLTELRELLGLLPMPPALAGKK
jgi:hypothetical protein